MAWTMEEAKDCRRRYRSGVEARLTRPAVDEDARKIEDGESSQREGGEGSHEYREVSMADERDSEEDAVRVNTRKAVAEASMLFLVS